MNSSQDMSTPGVPSRILRTAATALVIISLVAAAPVVASATTPPTPEQCATSARGRLLSVTELPALSRAEAATQLAEAGITGGAGHGTSRYRVGYCTVGPSGRPTAASGQLALPTPARDPLPVVTYAHGTNTARTDAPSFLGTAEGTLAPVVFAAAGFAVAAPDYVGLGAALDAHPYLHAATEASASADLLRAATEAAAGLNRQLSSDVFVTGHSQGGHAAMAIGEELRRFPDWRVRALAPMAGPYDLSGIGLPAALDPALTDPDAATVYLAYLFTSWKSVYGLYSDSHQVFAAPYADKVETLFDGTHDMAVIGRALPTRPADLFTPQALAQIAAPSGRLAQALRANDVCRSRPPAPVRLYAAHGDRDVTFAHAQRCLDQIADRGGQVELVDLGDTDHVGTAIAGLPRIRDWFQQMRAGG
jgi:hypothetical protein